MLWLLAILIIIALPFIAHTTKRKFTLKIINILVYLFGFIGWLVFIGFLIFWHLSVEPSLDGSEGSGPGFGFFLVHVFLPMLAIASSIYALFLSMLTYRPLTYSQKERILP